MEQIRKEDLKLICRLEVDGDELRKVLATKKSKWKKGIVEVFGCEGFFDYASSDCYNWDIINKMYPAGTDRIYRFSIYNYAKGAFIYKVDTIDVDLEQSKYFDD